MSLIDPPIIPVKVTTPDPNIIKNKNKKYLHVNMTKPKIIIQEGRDFLIVKETKNKNDEKNHGIIVNKKDDFTELKITDNINEKIKLNMLGGNDDIYYNKYLKYKYKYLELKNKLS